MSTQLFIPAGVARRQVIGGLILVSIALLGFAIGYVVRSGNRAIPTESVQAASQTLADCTQETIAVQIKPTTLDTKLLREIQEICYTRGFNQGLLNDFQIRRGKFLQQSYDERILLWMVVGITISGVFLAGVQLVASYRLATSGTGQLDQAGEISLERTRISLKSSVTGLFILVISFAFFFVFVYEIYKIKDIDPDGRSKAAQVQPGISGGATLGSSSPTPPTIPK